MYPFDFTVDFIYDRLAFFFRNFAPTKLQQMFHQAFYFH